LRGGRETESPSLEIRMLIEKNYLDKKTFKKVYDHLLGLNFPWYFNDYVLEPTDQFSDHFQFTHHFYRDGEWNSLANKWVVDPFIDKLQPMSIVRIKANLQPKYHKIIEHGFHSDVVSDNAKITTAIFYVNSNNGYTLFENNKKVKSIANSLCSFDSRERHTGTTCTDEKCRIVINFNYIKL
jgi:hypothetical protein